MQLLAVATLKSGATEDVSARALWQSSNLPTAVVSSTGLLLRSPSSGTGSTRLQLTVGPNNTTYLTGALLKVIGPFEEDPTALALVQVSPQ